MQAGRTAVLGDLVPADLSELLRTHALQLRRAVLGRRHGRHASARAGLGLDFRDHRAYVPGDDPRLLDWRAVARRDRLVLRQTEAEDELSLVVALDAGANMGYGEQRESKFEVARALTAALSWAALRQGDRAGLVLAGDDELDAALVSPRSGSDRLDAIARRLGQATARGRAPLSRIPDAVAARLPARSLFVLVTDFLDPAQRVDDAEVVERDLLRGLAQLRARGHDVIVLQILHRDELEFPWRDHGVLRFVDRRGLRRDIEGAATAMRARYLERLGAHLRQLTQACEAHGIVLERVISDAALAPAFVSLLGRIAGQPPGAQVHP